MKDNLLLFMFRLSQEIIHMQFSSSRPLKIVKTFLGHVSVARKLFTILVYIEKCKIAELGK